MGERDLPDDVEAEAQAARPRSSRRRAALERLEDGADGLERNGGPVVVDAHCHVAIRAAHGDLHGQIRRPVADGIHDEVRDRLVDPVRVPFSPRITFYAHLDLGSGKEQFRLFGDEAAGVGEVHRARVGRQSAALLRPGVVEQIVDHAIDPLRAAGDASDDPGVAHLQRLALQERRRGADHAERIAQVVGEDSAESLGDLERLAQPALLADALGDIGVDGDRADQLVSEADRRRRRAQDHVLAGLLVAYDHFLDGRLAGERLGEDLLLRRHRFPCRRVADLQL